MDAKKAESVDSLPEKTEPIRPEDIQLDVNEMRVVMPHDRHDPLVAAVALFNAKYAGEVVRLWYTQGNIQNFRMLLKWDLGTLAYRLLTHDAAGTRMFSGMDMAALLQLSDFVPLVLHVYCDVSEWDSQGKTLAADLCKECAPANYRIVAAYEKTSQTVTYKFVGCGTTGRLNKATLKALGL